MPSTFTPRPATRIPDQERELPVGLTANNEPISLSRAYEQPAIGNPLVDLSEKHDYSRRLAIARIRARKSFRVAVLGGPNLDRDDAIREIERGTEVGDTLVRAEIAAARRYLEAAQRQEQKAFAGFSEG